MRKFYWSLALALTAASLPAAAQQPSAWLGGPNAGAPCPPPPCLPPYPGGGAFVPGQPLTGPLTLPPGTQPGAQQPGAQQPGAQPPASPLDSPAGAGAAFAGAGESGSGAVASAAQYTFGDLIGVQGNVGRSGFNGSSTSVSVVPIVSRYGGIKIADLESPRPTNRVYLGYNYYYNVNKNARPEGVERLDVHRELVGFELAPQALGGNASFGMRLPFNQFAGGGFSESNIIGDLTMNFKYALVNDQQTGNVLSGGLCLTLPTGEREGAGAVAGAPSVILDPITGAVVATVPGADPDINTRSVLFQPWTGAIYNFGPLYAIGFSSLIIPTDSRDVLLWTSAIAVGYNLIRPDPCQCPTDRLITGLAPVIELHSNTPLNHTDSSDPIFFKDQLNLTTGVYLSLRRAIIGGAIGVPLVGPKPYDLEAIANVQFRF